MINEVTSKSLGGPSELVMVMPIRKGFAECLETRTYKSRLKTAAKLFSDLRIAARESRSRVPISDVVDRIDTICSVFIAVLEDPDDAESPGKMLLAVAFDQPWEPYIRVIQRDLGSLLDTLLCNCEDYVGRHNSELGYEAFASWVRKYQINTDTFYLANGLTVSDMRRHEQLAAFHRLKGPGAYEGAVRLQTVAAEKAAENARIAMSASAAGAGELVKLGIKAATALLGLTSLYPKGTVDHAFLRNAAYAVLGEFMSRYSAMIPSQLAEQFRSEIDWAAQQKSPVPPGTPVQRAVLTRDDIQGGVIEPYSKADLGCIVLLRVQDAATARAAIGAWSANVATAQANHAGSGPFRNIAFTAQGLRNIGLSAEDLACFPKDFRDGLAARAGLLGDIREDHPDQWNYPRANWPLDAAPDIGIGMDAIDVVVQVRITADPRLTEAERTTLDSAHPLVPLVEALETALAGGLVVLGVELMHRLPGAVEHFGFKDPVSQPKMGFAPSESQDLGVVLLGQENCRVDVLSGLSPTPLSILGNGTFLVLRKQSQHVERLRAAVTNAASATIDVRTLYAKLMGRFQDGTSLTNPRTTIVDFANDPLGEICPLRSHVRRTNPRGTPAPPRILRRGMSYGTVAGGPDTPRGLIFQAYCASIGEQYEVIQRWINGGNSTGLSSAESDPILGHGPADERRIVELPLPGGSVHRVDLGHEPFVGLEWGMYLFVPSLPGLAAITSLAPAAASDLARRGLALASAANAISDERARGLRWKALLEEKDHLENGDRDAVWAHVRAQQGGVLRLPAVGIELATSSRMQPFKPVEPVLVGSANAVEEVLTNATDYSVSEYDRRLGLSSGKIYLGLDPGTQYTNESVINAELEALPFDDAFDFAYRIARAAIEKTSSSVPAPLDVPLTKYVDLTLAGVTEHWFGVSAMDIELGNEPLLPNAKAHCPFHFTSPSRYVFSPWPTDFVEKTGIADGTMLLDKVMSYAPTRRTVTPTAPITGIIHRAYPGAANDGLFARSLLGILLAMLPTVQGNFLNTMQLLLAERTLWRVQDDLMRALLNSAGPASLNVARADVSRVRQAAVAQVLPQLKHAILRRPVPSMVYRQVTKQTTLEGLTLNAGDRVVLGLASASVERTQSAGTADADIKAVFGDRYAPAADPNRPTHGCPGWNMGLGTVLGLVSALLVSGTLYPTFSDLAVVLDPS